ncbi:para-nitrobenzyl esterase-like [Mercenaria mercenaria]|uniref:para-nitrobenzyl esterase-like n=1 Tax=Mercenaria mercenaria TaxID=6596 RepID=UPI00234F3FA1|nr:para-nitrobenzyl esterase-like [Mercenaria mercenaria]
MGSKLNFFVVLNIVAFFKEMSGFLLQPDADTTVHVNCGKVRGEWSTTDSGFSFKGIPYAVPPVGHLRWRPPIPVRTENNNCWTGTLQARQFGSPCVQRDSVNISNVIGSEDCLYLNVLTPTLDTHAKLPVMFWIHGGYLLFGNGNQYDIGYAPTLALAKKLNVVFVSINYRLNAFGFMALEWLKNGSSTNTSGNYGFMDMIEGLRWVQENIHSFGGDSSQVTAFGQSSGGTSLIALLSSPLCKGLFSKVWMLSASPVMNKTAPEAFKDNEIFIRNAGCGDVSCLFNLSASKVITSIPWDVYPYWAMDDLLALPERGRFDGALAIVDGYVLHETPFEAWARGNGVDVPVLIGSTAQEADQSPVPVEVLNWTWSTSEYRDHVTKKLCNFSDIVANAALNLYPENASTPEFQLTTMISDLRVNCGTNYLATVIAAGIMSPVYRYVATYYTKGQSATPFGTMYPVNYAYHGIDIFGFFGTMNNVLANGRGSNDTVWEDRVQREISSFVKTGKPDTADWLQYPDSTAELDTETKAFRGYHSSQCEFWLQNGFFSYSWIN